MRCFVASDEAPLADRIRECLVNLGHACPLASVASLETTRRSFENRSGGATSASLTDPELIVLALAPNPEKSLALLRDLHSRVGARILAVGPTTETKLVLRAIREGAIEFVDQDDLVGEMSEALNRLSVSGARGTIAVVLSPSGGAGCSTIAASAAVALAHQHGSCGIVDLNLDLGDLSTLFDLKPHYTIAELCANVRRLDNSLLEGCLVRHDSGVHLIAAPASFADSSKVTEDGIIEVLNLTSNRFPYVVVDLAGTFRRDRLQVLKHADLVVVVMRLDFTSLRNTRGTLEFLAAAGIPPEKIRLVANRFGQPNEISSAQAEEALGVKIAKFVPDDPRTVNRANNSGIPVIVQSPSSKVARSIGEIAIMIGEKGPH